MSKNMKIGPYSAYAIAVKYGYTGTEQQWIEEQEANRVASEQAAQRAEAARDNAETAATRAETARKHASDSLQELKDGIANGNFKGEKGDRGEKGDTGETGPAATVAVGTVTGLGAGAAPTVTNSGDEHNAVLNQS